METAIHPASAPQLSHTSFLALTSHEHEMDSKDRTDWLKGIRFLLTSLERAHWPGDLPTASELLQAIGKICANNFGAPQSAGTHSCSVLALCIQPCRVA